MEVRPAEHIQYDDPVSDPVYRVHFWHVNPNTGANLDARLLTGATDVREAIAWAEANHDEHPWELFALADVPRALGEEPERWWLRLYGTSPLEPTPGRPAQGARLSFERREPPTA